MIESRFWRMELAADIRWLRANRKYKRWSEKRVVLYERKLVLVAAQVRTLLERPKVNDNARGRALQAVCYPKVSDRPFTLIGWGWPHDHFDAESPQATQLSVWDVCNQLIHHYWMTTSREAPGEFTTITVCSDYMRNTCLYDFDLVRLIELFSVYSKDESAVYGCEFVWKEKKQDYLMQNARGPRDGDGVVSHVG